MRQSACCVLILFIIFHKVSGSISSSQLVSVSTTSAHTTQSLQNYFTTSVVVEGPSTSFGPLMTSHIILASPCSSSASSMFTEQPSSTYVIPSSPAVYSSMKLPESSPEPNSTQIYNLNASTVGPPTTANTTKPSTTGGTEEPDAKSWMWIIIGASVGGVVVFMIVVIIVCRCLKRKRKKQKCCVT